MYLGEPKVADILIFKKIRQCISFNCCRHFGHCIYLQICIKFPECSWPSHGHHPQEDYPPPSPPCLSSHATALCLSQLKSQNLYFHFCVPRKALDTHRATWMSNLESGLRNNSQLSKSLRNNGVCFCLRK